VLQQPLEGHSDAFYQVAFSPNSRLLERQNDGVWLVVFSLDSRLLASVAADRIVRLGHEAWSVFIRSAVAPWWACCGAMLFEMLNLILLNLI
jgi:hypothetical protein